MRPSQETDKQLIKAAKELMLEQGSLDIPLRAIAKKAKVNMGMFYYHFEDREDFISKVLQEFYEDFFSGFSLDSSSADSPMKNLEGALLYIGKFASMERPLIAAIFLASVNGDKTVQQFLKKNFTRHLRILIGLIKEAQKKKQMVELAPFNALVMMMAGLNAPTFVYSAFSKNPFTAAKIRILGATKESVLSPRALEERVQIVLRGLRRDL